MLNWDKLQYKYERKAFRIVNQHIKKILTDIPLNNVSVNTYKYLFEGNITESKIKTMFVELYTVIGVDYSNRIKKSISKEINTKKLSPDDSLIREILLFLSNEGGLKITSVRNSLINDLIEAVKLEIEARGTVIDLQNVIYQIVSRSQLFYKWQALRIARTETTSASNFSALHSASESEIELTKEWIAVRDDRTRLDHTFENGQIVDFDAPFQMADGSLLGYPGDIKAKPSQIINCRCTIAFKGKRDADGMLIFKK